MARSAMVTLRPARRRPVGTSSIRRRALSRRRGRPQAVEFRGNLDNRLRKISEGEVEAAVLAAAGIARLGLWEAADPARWIPPGGSHHPVRAPWRSRPAPAATEVLDLLAALDDPEARATLECERAFSERLEGGCSVPLGCFAEVSGDRLLVTGYLGHPSGTNAIRDRISGGLRRSRHRDRTRRGDPLGRRRRHPRRARGRAGPMGGARRDAGRGDQPERRPDRDHRAA